VGSKLIFVLLLAYLATTVAAWFWWTNHAQSRLQAEIDAIHARGEPVTLEEIQFFRQLPPERNAFTFYLQAVETVEALDATVHGEPGGWPSLYVLNDYPAWRREHADEAADFLAACRPALDLIRQARDMDGVPLTNPGSTWAHQDAFSYDLSYTRQATKLCQLAAAMAHDAGDDREAFEYLRDILHLRDLLGEHPTLLSSLTQIAVGALAVASIEQIAPTLRIGDGPGDVAVADVRELVERLVQADPLLATARKAVIAERVGLYELALQAVRRADTAGARFSFHHETGPLVNANLALLLRLSPVFYPDHFGERYGDKPGPQERIELTKREAQLLDRLQNDGWNAGDNMGFVERRGKFMVIPLLGTLPARAKYRTLVYRGVASHRMAGLALLMRAYEVETGRPVDTLDDLAPRYLASLPEDPFSPTGQPPRYLPDDPYPRLYCLDWNQQDDGGDGGSRKPPYRETKDWLFFLNNTRDQAEERDEQPPPAKTPRQSLVRPDGRVHLTPDMIMPATATRPADSTSSPSAASSISSSQ